MQIYIIKIGYHLTGHTTSFFPTPEAMSAQGDRAMVSACSALLKVTLKQRRIFLSLFPFPGFCSRDVTV